MSNLGHIGSLFDKGSELRGVQCLMFDAGAEGQNWIDAIEFTFSHGVVATVYVEAEFDTLRVELAKMVRRQADDLYLIDASTLFPWSELIGSRLAWIWVLTNQRGYEDGLRFEFNTAIPREVTLIAIASRISVFSSELLEVGMSKAARLPDHY